jgi:hypothetical protein
MQRLKKPGILRGLDSDNIISTPEIEQNEEDTTNMFSTPPPTETRRRTTRQTIHGRQDALYDVKYHPMDDVVRPSNAIKRRNHAVIRVHDNDDEDDDMGHTHSSFDEEGKDRSAKKQRSIGTRHSKRPAAQRMINYSTQNHPQDNILRQIDSDIIPTRNGPRKKKCSVQTVVIHEDSSSSSDETEESRPKRSAIRRSESKPDIADSISPSETKSDDPDRFLEEFYGTLDMHSEPSRPEVEDLHVEHFTPTPNLLHWRYPSTVKSTLGHSQVSRGSLVAYSDSDDATDENVDQQNKDAMQQDQTDIDSSDTELPRLNGQKSGVQNSVLNSKGALIQYSSGISFSSQISAGQPGKPFSKARVLRRAAGEPFHIHHDSEEKMISLAERAVTEVIARESDHPKENIYEGITEENTPFVVEYEQPAETALPVARPTNQTQQEGIIATANPELVLNIPARATSPHSTSSQHSEVVGVMFGESTIAVLNEAPATTQGLLASSLVSQTERWRLSPPLGPSQPQSRKRLALDKLPDIHAISTTRSTSVYDGSIGLRPSRSSPPRSNGIRIIDEPIDLVTACCPEGGTATPETAMGDAVANALAHQGPTADSQAKVQTGQKSESPSQTTARVNVNPEPLKVDVVLDAQQSSPWKPPPDGQSIFGYSDNPDNEVNQHFDDAMGHHA